MLTSTRVVPRPAGLLILLLLVSPGCDQLAGDMNIGTVSDGSPTGDDDDSTGGDDDDSTQGGDDDTAPSPSPWQGDYAGWVVLYRVGGNGGPGGGGGPGPGGGEQPLCEGDAVVGVSDQGIVEGQGDCLIWDWIDVGFRFDGAVSDEGDFEGTVQQETEAGVDEFETHGVVEGTELSFDWAGEVSVSGGPSGGNTFEIEGEFFGER